MKIDLDRLEELERKATDAPWSVGTTSKGEKDDPPSDPYGMGAHYLLAEKSPYSTSRPHWGAFRSLHGCAAPLYQCDADFLAALRNHAPALIAAARLADAQARELAALRATCREVAGELRATGSAGLMTMWHLKLADRLDPPRHGGSMNTSDRILRLWEKVPETRVMGTGIVLEHINCAEPYWVVAVDHPDEDAVPIPDQQAHDLAGAEIERWILRAGYWTEIKSRRDSLQGLANVTIAYWVGGEKIICGGDTKIEALLAAAERVAGLETT